MNRRTYLGLLASVGATGCITNSEERPLEILEKTDSSLRWRDEIKGHQAMPDDWHTDEMSNVIDYWPSGFNGDERTQNYLEVSFNKRSEMDCRDCAEDAWEGRTLDSGVIENVGDSVNLKGEFDDYKLQLEDLEGTATNGNSVAEFYLERK